jgi:hypothetical protein
VDFKKIEAKRWDKWERTRSQKKATKFKLQQIRKDAAHERFEADESCGAEEAAGALQQGEGGEGV